MASPNAGKMALATGAAAAGVYAAYLYQKRHREEMEREEKARAEAASQWMPLWAQHHPGEQEEKKKNSWVPFGSSGEDKSKKDQSSWFGQSGKGGEKKDDPANEKTETKKPREKTSFFSSITSAEDENKKDGNSWFSSGTKKEGGTERDSKEKEAEVKLASCPLDHFEKIHKPCPDSHFQVVHKDCSATEAAKDSFLSKLLTKKDDKHPAPPPGTGLENTKEVNWNPREKGKNAAPAPAAASPPPPPTEAAPNADSSKPAEVKQESKTASKHDSKKEEVKPPTSGQEANENPVEGKADNEGNQVAKDQDSWLEWIGMGTTSKIPESKEEAGCPCDPPLSLAPEKNSKPESEEVKKDNPAKEAPPAPSKKDDKPPAGSKKDDKPPTGSKKDDKPPAGSKADRPKDVAGTSRSNSWRHYFMGTDRREQGNKHKSKIQDVSDYRRSHPLAVAPPELTSTAGESAVEMKNLDLEEDSCPFELPDDKFFKKTKEVKAVPSNCDCPRDHFKLYHKPCDTLDCKERRSWLSSHKKPVDSAEKVSFFDYWFRSSRDK